MKQNKSDSFERFMHEVFSHSYWTNTPSTYEDALKQVREAYPKKKFTRADFLQRKLRYEQGGV